MVKLHIESLKPIILKTPLGFDYFYYDEIIMIEANGNCSIVYTINRSCSLRVLHNLAFIERKYCNGKLFRCHKSFIINIIYIQTLVLKTHEVQLKNSYVVPISEKCLKYIKQQSSKLI